MSSTKKILCVIDYLRPGGAQSQLINLALNFNKDGHNVSFLTYRESDFHDTVLNENNIVNHCIIESNYFKRLIKMRTYIREGEFDIIISFLQTSNFICELATLPFKRWKLIVGERSANPNIFKSRKLMLYRYFHFFADYVVANSQANMKIVKQINPFLSNRKLKVIYNSLDLDFWKSEVLLDTCEVNKKDKFIISVAATQLYVKNLICLVEAVNLLPHYYQKKLLIHWYGEGIEKPFKDSSYLEGCDKIKDYGLEETFIFFNATNDIKSAYNESDAVGLFSLYEGFPNVICEAMACAKPVVCSSVSDVPLLFNNHELLFDPKEASELKNVLIKLMEMSSEELENIGLENRLLAEKYFDQKYVVDQFYELMK